jgi:hypothetical protein
MEGLGRRCVRRARREYGAANPKRTCRLSVERDSTIVLARAVDPADNRSGGTDTVDGLIRRPLPVGPDQDSAGQTENPPSRHQNRAAAVTPAGPISDPIVKINRGYASDSDVPKQNFFRLAGRDLANTSLARNIGDQMADVRKLINSRRQSRRPTRGSSTSRSQLLC